MQKKGICRLMAAGITVLILGTLLPGQYRDLPFALGEEVVTAQEAPDATETPAVTEDAQTGRDGGTSNAQTGCDRGAGD